jgi:hypothetical protein
VLRSSGWRCGICHTLGGARGPLAWAGPKTLLDDRRRGGLVLRARARHAAAASNAGLAGPAYIEPKHEVGAYDQEIFLVMKEFAPFLQPGGDMAMDMLALANSIRELEETGAKADKETKGTPKGYEVS